MNGNDCSIRVQSHVCANRVPVATNANPGESFKNNVEFLCGWHHGGKTTTATCVVVIAAGDAVAEESSERFNLVVTPTRFKNNLRDQVRCDISRYAIGARNVTQSELRVRRLRIRAGIESENSRRWIRHT